MIALIAIVYAIAVGMIASPVFAQGQDIKSFVSQLYIEGVPYEEATLFDPDAAVPTLLDMLADPNEEQHWPNVVTTLGMLGDARAVEPLIQFLEEDPGKRLSHVHYIAKTGVMMALGYLINKDENQEALAYLKDSVNPRVWAKRKTNWISPYHANTSDRNSQLSKMAIVGLALSGHPSARDTLEALQRPGISQADREFQTRVSHVISEALNAHKMIFRDGLHSYDAKRRRQ
jgi:HEAT repeat protein